MTGAQFSTPSPTVFNQSPIQSQQPTGYMQPQMTGIQPQPTGAAHSIFTPQGSMQCKSIYIKYTNVPLIFQYIYRWSISVS